jgi:hypothetical protein
MSVIIPIQKNITPAAAAQVLAANGLAVSEEKAAAILAFLYNLANSTAKK